MPELVYRYRMIGGPCGGTRFSSTVLLDRIHWTPIAPPTPKATESGIPLIARRAGNRFMRHPETYFLVRLSGYRGVLVADSQIRRLRARTTVRNRTINQQIAIRCLADHPSYCVCETCGALHPAEIMQRSICPYCNGMRFSTGIDAITEWAAIRSVTPPSWELPSSE